MTQAKGITIIIELSNHIEFRYERTKDSVSIHFLWLEIDLIRKPKSIFFREMLDDYQSHGF